MDVFEGAALEAGRFPAVSGWRARATRGEGLPTFMLYASGGAAALPRTRRGKLLCVRCP